MTPKPVSKTHQKQLKVLGQYFRECRLSAGLTQFELADELLLNRRTIVRIEQGKNFTILTAMELADGLGVDIKDLMSILDDY